LGILASIITDAYGVDAIASPKWWCTFLLLVIMSAILRFREDV
jgi:hypothetical protein